MDSGPSALDARVRSAGSTRRCSRAARPRPRARSPRAPTRRSSGDREGGAGLHLDALHARPRIRRRAGGPRLGDVGDAGVLLGAARAAERAHPRADATAHVAVEEVARPAEPLDPAADHRGVAAGQVGWDLHDIELALDAAEPRLELGLGELVQPKLVAPALE